MFWNLVFCAYPKRKKWNWDKKSKFWIFVSYSKNFKDVRVCLTRKANNEKILLNKRHRWEMLIMKTLKQWEFPAVNNLIFMRICRYQRITRAIFEVIPGISAIFANALYSYAFICSYFKPASHAETLSWKMLANGKKQWKKKMKPIGYIEYAI